MCSFEKPIIDSEGKVLLDSTVYAQVIEDQSLQNANSTVALIKSALTTYKEANKHITKCWLKSDNAAAYKVNSSACGMVIYGFLLKEKLIFPP